MDIVNNRNLGFTIIDNDIIRHMENGLSAEALGLYCVIKLYSTSKTFEMNKESLIKILNEPKQTIENAINELKEFGYIKEI